MVTISHDKLWNEINIPIPRTTHRFWNSIFFKVRIELSYKKKKCSVSINKTKQNNNKKTIKKKQHTSPRGESEALSPP